jgi:hypothetical protein
MTRGVTVVILLCSLVACGRSRPAPDGKFHVRSTMAVEVLKVNDVVLEGSEVVNHVRVLTVRMPNGHEGEILIATDEPVAAGDRVSVYEFNLRNPFRTTELAQTEPITLAIRSN